MNAIRIKLIAALQSLVVLLEQQETMEPKYPKVMAWAKAIGNAENAKPGLFNPGDLKLTTLTESWGASQGFQAADGGWIAKFPTEAQGMAALYNFLVLLCDDQLIAFHDARTLYAAMVVYAGNPANGYIQGIANALGVPLATDVSTFLT